MIKKIVISNFKGIENKEIDVKDINILSHETGFGKTSILDSIRFVFTGEYEKNPIYNNGKKASVKLICDDDVTIERTISSNDTGFLVKVKLNGNSCSQKVFNDYIKNNMFNVDVYKKICNPSVFADMSGAEISNFLLKIIPIDITLDMVLKFGEIEDIDTQMELSDIFKELEINPDNIKLEDLTKIYDFCFDKRKDLKKTVKTYEAKCIYEGEKPVYSKEDIQNKLSEIMQLEEKQKLNNKLKIDYENALKIKTSNENSLAEKEKALKELSEITYLPEKENELNISKVNIQNTIVDLKSRIKLDEFNINKNNQLLERLSKDICPLSEKLVCKTDKSTLKEEITKTISVNEKDRDEANDKLATKIKELEEVEKNLKETIENKLIFEKRKMLMNEITRLKTLKVELPEKPIIGEIKDYSEEKMLLNAKLKNIALYEQYLINNATLVEQRFTCGIYETLTQRFSPTGIILSKLVNYAIGPFVTKLNEVAENINDNYRINLVVDNGIKILCKTAESEIEYTSLSGGERILFAFVLFDLINMVYKNTFLVLDNCDRIDKNTFMKLLTVIKDRKNNYSNIFISLINHSDLTEAITTVFDDVNII